MSRTLTFWFAVLLLFCGGMLLWLAKGGRDSRPDDEFHTVAQVDEVQQVAASGDMEFTLTDQDEASFDSSSLDGKIWVGSVFFSSCPSTCRAQNQQVASLQKKFGGQGVEFVSITCDPEKDTPRVMKDYARMFGAQHDKWHFLTGDYELVEKIGTEKFGITVQPQVHSDRLVLFDKDGTCYGAFRSTDMRQFEKLVDKIEELLAQSPATEAAAAEAETDAEPAQSEEDPT